MSSVQRVFGRAFAALIALLLVLATLTVVSPAYADEPTPTPTPEVTVEPTPEDSPSPEPAPSDTPSPDPTDSADPAPSDTATPEVSPAPTESGAPEPTAVPTEVLSPGAGIGPRGVASFEGTGSIAGSITFPGLAPVEDIQVNVYSSTDQWSYYSTWVDEFGAWQIDGLSEGDYRVETDYWGSLNVVDEWWQDAADFESATDIPVGDGEAVTGIDLVLESGASIAGVVSGPGGPQADVQVQVVNDEGGWVRSGVTDGSGDYTVDGLAAGTYSVQFSDYSTGGGLVAEWYDDQPTFEDSDTIVLSAAQQLTGVDATLALGATLTGSVTAGGNPVDGVRVDVFPIENTWDPYVAYTADGGVWAVGGLPTGDYVVRFADTYDTEYAIEWYDNAVDRDAAETLSVVAGQTYDEIDAVLVAGASITGTITATGGAALAYASVDIYLGTGHVRTVYANDEGEYEAHGLSAGSYRLKFTPQSDDEGPSLYVGEWWDNQTSLATATTFALAAGGTTTKNAELSAGAQISGTVRASSDPGSGLENWAVDVYTSRGVYLYQYGTETASDGSYVISGLPAGSYKLRFVDIEWDDPSPLWKMVWWDGKQTLGTATAIALVGGQVLDDLDLIVPSGHAIQGTLTYVDGSPAEGITVNISSANRTYQATATDASGGYQVNGLAPGRYTLAFFDNGHYVEAGATESGGAAEIVELGSSDLTFDYELSWGAPGTATVTGRVVDSEGDPVSDIYVTLYDAETGDYAGDANSDSSSGEFAIGALDPGDYVLLADGWDTFTATWWDSAADRNDAQVITVGSDVTVALGDVELLPASGISGTIESASGDPIADVDVYAYDEFGFYAGYGYAEEGEYRVGGLSAGTYTLEFAPGFGSEYVHEWWQDETSFEDAAFITVGAQTEVTGIDAVLGEGATITGTHPLTSYGSVELHDADGVFVTTTSIGEGESTYTLTGVSPGSYRIDLVASGDGSYERVLTSTVTVTSLGQTVIKNLSLSGTGSISGEVTAQNGDKLDGIQVFAWRSGAVGGVPITASTGSDGHGEYTLAGILPGTYTVSFSEFASGAGSPAEVEAAGGTFYEVQFSNNSPTAAGADPITVASGQHRTGFDAVMVARGPTLPFTTATPTITIPSGGLKVGQTLTAVRGTWTPAPTSTSYQWLRNGSPIPGATSSTYQLVGADAGTYIAVTVTGSKTGYTSASETSTTTAMVTGGTLSPAPVPTILGTAAVGQELGAQPGTWGPGSVDLAYQWKRDGVAILNADEAQYVVQNADAGSKITVTVTGSRTGFTSVSKTSVATATVTGGGFDTSPTTITGNPVVGSKLTAVRGLWSPVPTTTTYRWYRNGVAISGATASTYTLVTADAGKTITVEVTGARTGVATASVLSDPTAMITGGVFSSAATPTISGIAVLGETLTANVAAWTPLADFAYQWKRGGVAIAGADGSTYLLTQDDVGTKITVTVTGTARGFIKAATSSSTATVLDVFDAAVVNVVGDLVFGSTLSVDLGTWPDAPRFSYQWLRNGVPISRATAATYKLGASDLGRVITVRVTATKTGFKTLPMTVGESVPVASLPLSATPNPTITIPPAGAVVGQTLKAVPGVWGPATVTLSYQWLRDDVPISRATSSSYKLVSLDAGTEISVRVMGSKTGYGTEQRFGPVVDGITGGVFTAPTPKIVGAATVGQVLSVTTGTWSPVPAFSYQWKRNGAAIPDADDPTYVVVDADLGSKITVTVTGVRDGVTTKSVTSAATATVLDEIEPVGPPTVIGDRFAGATLSVHTGFWSETPTSFSYQWLRNGAVISKATAATYKLGSADIGTQISVRVTAKKTGFGPATQTSAQTGPIEALTFVTTPTPTITVPPAGAVIGQTLKAVPGTWSPSATLTYQWFRYGDAIFKATASTYKLVSADYGSQISVRVTGAKTLYATTSMTSLPTAEVGGLLFTSTPTPTITVPAAGVVVGQTLKAVPGTWSPSATLAYQWLRDGVPISKATLSSYKLVTADAGAEITVQVTGSKTAYLTVETTSAPVGAVVGTAFPLAIPAVGDVVVGEDIEPGTYVTVGNPAMCYWERLSSLDGDPSSVIVSTSTPGQRIVDILGGDFAFSSFGCNGWIELSDSAAPQATTFAGTGEYAVGHHIAPGTYTSTTSGECTWTRLSSFTGTDVIDGGYQITGPTTVTIQPGDFGFSSYGCGTWTLAP